MRNIVVACCILHNFLRGIDNDESLLAQVDRDLENAINDRHQTHPRDDNCIQGAHN